MDEDKLKDLIFIVNRAVNNKWLPIGGWQVGHISIQTFKIEKQPNYPVYFSIRCFHKNSVII